MAFKKYSSELSLGKEAQIDSMIAGLFKQSRRDEVTVSKVVSVEPTGNSFASNGNTFHEFLYKLENGTEGTANHKTTTPRFSVGAEVVATIKGDFKGVNKLKLDKPSEGTGYRGGSKSSSKGGGFDQVGIEVGAAFNVASRLAAALIVSGKLNGDIVSVTKDIASKVLEASNDLKAEVSGTSSPEPVSTPVEPTKTVASANVGTIAPTPISAADASIGSMY
jgi:hypothetical protein